MIRQMARLDNIFGTELSFIMDYRFGVHEEYRHGEVVVWAGDDPMISRVIKKSDLMIDIGDSYELQWPEPTHCNIVYLRKATIKEKKLLGDKPFMTIRYSETGYDEDQLPF